MQKLAELIDKLSRIKHIPLATRIFSLFFTMVLLTFLFYGTISVFSFKFTSKTAMFIIWILWWPFLYITLLFFSRLWCGFLCPISLFNEAGNKLQRGKVKGVNYRKWAFVPFILFFVIVYLEQMSGLFLSTSITFWFIITSFTLAFLMGIMLSRYAFCKLVCPIGVILGLFGRLSIIGLRTKKEVCAKCTKQWCILGGRKAPACPVYINVPKINTNKDCLICANCIKNCPHDAAYVGLVKPGKELIEKVNFSLSESFFIMALFGLAAILTTPGTHFARKIIYLTGYYPVGAVLRLADFLIGLAIFILFYAIISYILSKLLKVNLKTTLAETGYYFLPLIFTIMFFTISFGFLGPWLPIGEKAMVLIKYFFLTVGLIWSYYMVKKIDLPKNDKLTKTQVLWGRRILIGSLIILTLFWGIFLVSNNMTYADKEPVIAKTGKTIKMDSYSMGFTPNVIIAEKGQEITIEINNIDIIHSFDIDEFNVHVFLPAASVRTVTFTPNKTGEFMFYCNIPGHTEAGMRGRLIVVDSIEDYVDN